MAKPWVLLLVVLLAGCIKPNSGTDTETDSPPSQASDDNRTYGETRTLLRAPSPWYIEGVTVFGDRGFAGSAKAIANEALPLQSLNEPSRIFSFDLHNATALETILVNGEDLVQPHGLTGLKSDGQGRIYAASTQLGILRFTEGPDGWTQETYATLPDLPMCSPLTDAPCSPTIDDRPALGNDMTWDDAGNLYVTDSYQATIWRIPIGPGPAEVWYQHADLDRAFGANGLRISPDGTRMYVAVCCPDSTSIGPIDRASRIVTIPFPDPGTATPVDFAILDNGDGADGIAFGEHGDLYVASNGGNRIIILDTNGTLVRTITNDDLSGDGGFDFPASIAFHDRAIIIANYAITNVGGPADGGRTVVTVHVDDGGWAEARPMVP